MRSETAAIETYPHPIYDYSDLDYDRARLRRRHALLATTAAPAFGGTIPGDDSCETTAVQAPADAEANAPPSPSPEEQARIRRKRFRKFVPSADPAAQAEFRDLLAEDFQRWTKKHTITALEAHGMNEDERMRHNARLPFAYELDSNMALLKRRYKRDAARRETLKEMLKDILLFDPANVAVHTEIFLAKAEMAKKGQITPEIQLKLNEVNKRAATLIKRARDYPHDDVFIMLFGATAVFSKPVLNFLTGVSDVIYAQLTAKYATLTKPKDEPERAAQHHKCEMVAAFESVTLCAAHWHSTGEKEGYFDYEGIVTALKNKTDALIAGIEWIEENKAYGTVVPVACFSPKFKYSYRDHPAYQARMRRESAEYINSILKKNFSCFFVVHETGFKREIPEVEAAAAEGEADAEGGRAPDGDLMMSPHAHVLVLQREWLRYLFARRAAHRQIRQHRAAGRAAEARAATKKARAARALTRKGRDCIHGRQTRQTENYKTGKTKSGARAPRRPQTHAEFLVAQLWYMLKFNVTKGDAIQKSKKTQSSLSFSLLAAELVDSKDNIFGVKDKFCRASATAAAPGAAGPANSEGGHANVTVLVACGKSGTPAGEKEKGARHRPDDQQLFQGVFLRNHDQHFIFPDGTQATHIRRDKKTGKRRSETGYPVNKPSKADSELFNKLKTTLTLTLATLATLNSAKAPKAPRPTPAQSADKDKDKIKIPPDTPPRITATPPTLTATAYSVTPSAYSVTPSAYSVTPSAYSVTPSAYSVTPSAYSVTPSAWCPGYLAVPGFLLTPQEKHVFPELLNQHGNPRKDIIGSVLFGAESHARRRNRRRWLTATTPRRAQRGMPEAAYETATPPPPSATGPAAAQQARYKRVLHLLPALTPKANKPKPRRGGRPAPGQTHQLPQNQPSQNHRITSHLSTYTESQNHLSQNYRITESPLT